MHGENKWTKAESALAWRIEPFVGGYCPSRSDKVFAKSSPATGANLYHAPVGSSEDVDNAVAVARRRFDDGSWPDLDSGRRAEILEKFAELIEEHAEELALFDTLEIGKPITQSMFDAKVLAAWIFRTNASLLPSLVGDPGSSRDQFRDYSYYEPRGVVAAVIPWNFPVYMAALKVGPALAAGNTVVLKPSELASGSALKLAEIAIRAGVPEGVFNVVPGLGATVGEALVAHSDVDMVTFTGSTATGRRIMQLSASSFGKPVLLECGGKSPQVVFDDIEDIDGAAAAAAQSILWNSGQVCSAYTRLVVQKGVKDQLLERLLSKLAAFVPGSPLDEATTFGPLGSMAHCSRVRKLIEKGVAEGAKTLLSTTFDSTPDGFVYPTIFEAPDRTAEIVQEEIFGPVLSVQEFETEDEAVSLANCTNYGLVASVWTGDRSLGERMARRIPAAYVQVASKAIEFKLPDVPLGSEPRRYSGFGAEFGRKGLESYSASKVVSLEGFAI
jgi:acyl-CoA reductase-like NAD-dependent aldehyde dehydrogenase